MKTNLGAGRDLIPDYDTYNLVYTARALHNFLAITYTYSQLPKGDIY